MTKARHLIPLLTGAAIAIGGIIPAFAQDGYTN